MTSQGSLGPLLGKLTQLAKLIKIEHSIFALPFAYIGSFLAADGWPGGQRLAWLTLAMICIRTYAMSVNRVLDLPFDRQNPRTKDRSLVTGEVNRGSVLVIIAVCAGIFVFAAAKLNTLCLVLSPVALIWAAGYSLAKRFTSLTHFWLGSVLGLAPVAGWIAVHPVLVPTPVMFFWGVTFWVAGFDILYSCQDVSIDRMQGLNSLPARYGVGTALVLALFSHLVAALMFFMAGWQASLGWVFYLAWSLVSLLLIKEHTLISEEDMSRVNMAFFTFNGLIAIVLCLGIIVETLR